MFISSQFRSLPGYQEHVQLLCTQAAALLDPGYRETVARVVRSAPTSALEQAMAATVGLSMRQAGPGSVVPTEHVATFLPYLEQQHEAADRLFAVREAVGMSAAVLMTATEREEFGLPASIGSVAEARAFVSSPLINEVVGSAAPLLHDFLVRSGSVAICAPLVAIVAARMGRPTEEVGRCAVALAAAHRTLVLGTDLDGHPWFRSSMQMVSQEVIHAITSWLSQLTLRDVLHEEALSCWAGVGTVLGELASARPVVSDAARLGDDRSMPAERLRGLIIRLRRLNRVPVNMEMLLRMERTGAHPLYPQPWAKPPLPRLVQGGRHTPDRTFRRNERELLVRIASLLGRRDLDLTNTARPELDEAVDELVVHTNRVLQELLDGSRRPDAPMELPPDFHGVLKSLLDQWRRALPAPAEESRRATDADGTGDADGDAWERTSPRNGKFIKFVWDRTQKTARSGNGKWSTLQPTEQEIVRHLMERMRLIADEAAVWDARDEVAEAKLEMEPGITDAQAEARLLEAEEREPQTELAALPDDEPRGPYLLPPGEPPSEGGSDPDAN